MNFIIKEGATDESKIYESFIIDYNNHDNLVKDLRKKYGLGKYKRFYDTAVKEERIVRRGTNYKINGKRVVKFKRESGIKNVGITKYKSYYIWTYYIDGKKRLTSKYLHSLKQKALKNGFKWIILDPERLKQVKEIYNVQ